MDPPLRNNADPAELKCEKIEVFADTQIVSAESRKTIVVRCSEEKINVLTKSTPSLRSIHVWDAQISEQQYWTL